MYDLNVTSTTRGRVVRCTSKSSFVYLDLTHVVELATRSPNGSLSATFDQGNEEESCEMRGRQDARTYNANAELLGCMNALNAGSAPQGNAPTSRARPLCLCMGGRHVA